MTEPTLGAMYQEIENRLDIKDAVDNDRALAALGERIRMEDAGTARRPLAVHRTMLVVDVSAFGDRRRTNLHQLAVRRGLYEVLERAFTKAGVSWQDCDHEDRGDGALMVIPATVPKSVLVDELPDRLVAALREHNSARAAEEQIRLRLSLHAGEIHYDDYGVTGRAVNLAFRLLDAPEFKQMHRRSRSVLGLVASDWFYGEVIWHSATAEREAYRPIRVVVKETDTMAWMRLVEPERSAALPVSPQLSIARQVVGREAEFADLIGLIDDTADAAYGRVAVEKVSARPEALVTMINRDFGGALFSHVLHLTGNDRQWAEDVVQETLIRAWRDADRLDREPEVLRAWLFTVARRIVIETRRGHSARPEESFDPDIAEALAGLPPEHREVLVERYLRGRTANEVAAVLGLSPATVRSRLDYALRALRGVLRD